MRYFDGPTTPGESERMQASVLRHLVQFAAGYPVGCGFPLMPPGFDDSWRAMPTEARREIVRQWVGANAEELQLQQLELLSRRRLPEEAPRRRPDLLADLARRFRRAAHPLAG